MGLNLLGLLSVMRSGDNVSAFMVRVVKIPKNTMPVFFCKTKLILETEVSLSLQDSHHLLKSLRCRKGDYVKIVGLEPQIFLAQITEDKKIAVLKIKKKDPTTLARIYPTTLISAPLPSHCLHLMVEKLTELGLQKLYLVPLKNMSVRWKSQDVEKKIKKLEHLSFETQKQCERFEPLQITYFSSTALCLHKLRQSESQIGFLLERQNRKGLPTAYNPKNPWAIWIGPEGGWHKSEIDLFTKEKFHPFWAGPGILKTETAALFTQSLLKSIYENQT